MDNIREKRLLEFAIANAPKTVELSEKAEAVIDFNTMIGVLSDPTIEANKED